MGLRGLWPPPLRAPNALWQRLYNSTVLWSWVLNGFRLASGLLLLPLVLKQLSTTELGMYYVLLSQVALAPVIDFGFSGAVLRFVSYAMGGAETIQAHGVAPSTKGSPNFKLLWELFFTTRALYRVLALIVIVVLGAWGTYMVEMRINETPWPNLVRVAWLLTLTSTTLDIYSYWAPTFLYGMNDVLASVRITVVGAVVRFVLAAGLLIAGAGLLSLPIGSLIGSVLQQVLARRRCYQLLARHPVPAQVNTWHHLRIIWPNSWRQGVHTLSSYFTTNANTTICLSVLGLTANAQYGLSLQCLNIICGMATVWTTVKWQLVAQHRARQDYAAIQRLLWPRMWLVHLTFLAMATGLLVFGQPLLQWFGHGKQLLPLPWLALLTLNGFLFMRVNAWGSLIVTENRVPYLWSAVATNLLSFVFSLALIHTTSLGLGALVLGPLLAFCPFYYWYWPMYAVRGIKASWPQFIFSPPKVPRAQQALEAVESR
jgi:O-antigen/teichoic acid export membrane protein